jgi:hypothetical protein
VKQQVYSTGGSFDAIGILAAIGAAIGIGKMLAGKEKLTWRFVCGRALLSGGLGASAAAVLSWIPDLPFVALVGIACALVVAGETVVEKVIDRFTK